MVAGTDAALAEQRRGATGQRGDVAVLALDQQASEARVDREAEHASAERCRCAVRVDGVEAAQEGALVPAVEQLDGDGGPGDGVAQAEVGDTHAERAGVAQRRQWVDAPAVVGERGEADLDLRRDVAERAAVERAQGIFVVEDQRAFCAARDVDLGLERELTQQGHGGEEGGELQAVLLLHVEHGAGALDGEQPVVAVAVDLGDEATELEPAQELA